MEVDVVAQLVTLLTVGIAIVWQQQRSTDKLRDDFNTANRQSRQDHDKLRDDFNTANRELRGDHDKLREAIAQIGQRLARIEGFLGIGIPSALDESTGAEPD